MKSIKKEKMLITVTNMLLNYDMIYEEMEHHIVYSVRDILRLIGIDNTINTKDNDYIRVIRMLRTMIKKDMIKTIKNQNNKCMMFYIKK